MTLKHILTFLMVALCCSAGMAQTDKPSEEDYLDFLYQYMPLPDKADYPREFYAENVRATLKARAEMPWGKIIPEREFRHFVLPIRVNNENLDRSRIEFYKELAPRVRNLPLKDAVIEVNHWCHEKVTYRRTNQLAYGCREDSLRTMRRGVDIPRGGTALGGHTGPTSIYPAMGTYRRQPCLGGSLGGRTMVLPRCL